MPNEKSKSPRRRLGRLSFGLKGLFVAVTVTCAITAIQANRARNQARAVGQVRFLGGTLSFEYDDAGLPRFRDDAAGRSWAPGWLRSAVGDDYFGRVDTVNLGRFRQGGIEADDRGIGDSDLELLKALPRVRKLSLMNNRAITDSGLAHLRGLEELEVLDLSRTTVDGSGFKHLRKLSDLRILALSGAPITDGGLRELGLLRLKHLRFLDLSNTRISNAGLSYLTSMRSLQMLRLSGTDVSDAGLHYLVGLERLSTLDLLVTEVTPDGIASLQKAIPACTIHVTPSARGRGARY